MPGLADCQRLLRLLIARGDPKAIPQAEGAIDDYLEIAPVCTRKGGPRSSQDTSDLYGAAVGVQRLVRGGRWTPYGAEACMRNDPASRFDGLAPPVRLSRTASPLRLPTSTVR